MDIKLLLTIKPIGFIIQVINIIICAAKKKKKIKNSLIASISITRLFINNFFSLYFIIFLPLLTHPLSM